MKKFLKLTFLAAFVAAFGFSVGYSAGPVLAQENQEESQTTTDESENQDQEQAPEQEEQQEQSDNSQLSFTAQAGDSFTKIARKAVQIYGINNNVNLSGAQIVAAETFLASEAGFPELNVGQAVTMSSDTVKAAVDKAQALDASAVARWEKYVRFVDFNTNNVGEAR